jgi:hypothetical protein
MFTFLLKSTDTAKRCFEIDNKYTAEKKNIQNMKKKKTK